ncbi:MAG: SPOR domain-containing protein [Bdellovibrionaceae bacterium]|nr:SPOR domain-containing protein [Pseudobdellovibrionaceae bacterium]
MAAKSDVFVKMVLVFFISLLSFSIGTFVGKKYSDNQHKLASLEPGHGEKAREVASAHGEEGAASSSSSMSDEEISKLAEEFADDGGPVHGDEKKVDAHGAVAAKEASGTAHEEAKPAAHGVAAAHETKAVATAAAPRGATVHSAPAIAHDEVAIPAKNLIAGKQPTESVVKKAQTESRLPSSLPKDVAQYSVGKFTVQINSFASELEAKKRAEEMKSKGYSAFYVPATVKGKTWYRVSVGLFASEKEAKDYRNEFMSKSKVGDAIIQKISN